MTKGQAALEVIIEELKWTHNDGKTLTEFDKSRIEIIEKELQKPQEFYNKIKILRDNARLTRDEYEKKDLSKDENIGISAAIVTYNNILTIMENMFEIEVLK